MCCVTALCRPMLKASDKQLHQGIFLITDRSRILSSRHRTPLIQCENYLAKFAGCRWLWGGSTFGTQGCSACRGGGYRKNRFIMLFISFQIVASLLLCLHGAWSWGDLGHRTVAYLSAKYMTSDGFDFIHGLIKPTRRFDISNGAV